MTDKPTTGDPTPCLFVPPHEPFYCRIHADVRLALTDERCRRAEREARPDAEEHHFDAACEECRLRARGYTGG